MRFALGFVLAALLGVCAGAAVALIAAPHGSATRVVTVAGPTRTVTRVRTRTVTTPAEAGGGGGGAQACKTALDPPGEATGTFGQEDGCMPGSDGSRCVMDAGNSGPPVEGEWKGGVCGARPPQAGEPCGSFVSGEDGGTYEGGKFTASGECKLNGSPVSSAP